MRITALLLTLLALASCAPDTEGTGEAFEYRFSVRPVRVLASIELEEKCIESLEQSVLFYRELGVSMSLSFAAPWAEELDDTMGTDGVIAVVPGRLTRPKLAETRIARSILGDILAAKVTLDACEMFVVAHELGHALLGPEHTGEGNLMCRDVECGGWNLTDEQRARLRD